jgi:hypothetical protein
MKLVKVNKKPVRKPYTTADIKLLKQHSKARTPVSKISKQMKLCGIIEAKGFASRDWHRPSTIINLGQLATSFGWSAAGTTPPGRAN